MKKYGILFSSLFCAALFFFIITFSIALPIYFRPFYYAHVKALNLEQASGFTSAEIKTAYNEVLDYLTLPGKEFSSGAMKFSQEGKAHFADCKVLFNLNAAVLCASFLILVALLVLRHLKKTEPYILGGRRAAFYSGLAAILIPVITGGLASLNFDKAFTVFHTLFFPGKTNWIFNPYTDEIITVLPQTFFMNCAILIGASILTLSLLCIISGNKKVLKEN